MKKIQISPVHVVVGAVLLYALFFIGSDLDKAVDAITSFPPHLFLLMIALASLNYLIRFLKWQYYLRVLNISIPLLSSALIFLAGFSMTITPAKSGELLKAYLLRDHGYLVSRTAPIVLVERLTDLISMVILMIIGTSAYGFGLLPSLILLAFMLTGIGCFQNRRIASWLIERMTQFKMLERYTEKIHQLYSSTQCLTEGRPLIIGTFLSVCSWSFECLCLYVAVLGVGQHLPLISAVFICSSSILAGILAMLPGGLGATEGVLIVLMTRAGVTLAGATAATLLYRAATIWYAVGIGCCALLLLRRLQGKKTD